MQFAVKAVELGDIPEKGVFGVQETPRSKYIGELLDAFLESKDGIWEIGADETGQVFRTGKAAAKFSGSLTSKIRNSKRFSRLSCCTRGKRVFVSKVKIIQGGSR